MARLRDVVLVTDGGIYVICETHLEMLGIISGGVRTLFGLKLSEKKIYERKDSKARLLFVHLNALQSQHSWVGMVHSLVTGGDKGKLIENSTV